MDITRTRRLISAFGQWLQVIKLVNEKAKLQHIEHALYFSFKFPEQRDASEASRRARNCKRDAVRRALMNGYGTPLTVLAWPAVVDISVVDPHFLVLAFEHCFSAVKALRREIDPNIEQRACDAMKEFCDLWLEVRDVRNALEHEEEYIAGQGRRSELRDSKS